MYVSGTKNRSLACFFFSIFTTSRGTLPSGIVTLSGKPPSAVSIRCQAGSLLRCIDAKGFT